MSRANILNTRDRAKTPQDVFALLDALEGRAELFAALSDPNHGFYAAGVGSEEKTHRKSPSR